MTALPAGYYAVKSSLNLTDVTTGLTFGAAQGTETAFVYKGTEYSAVIGVNVFQSMQEALEAAVRVPECVIDGLDYGCFTTPVILFDAGNHKADKISLARPVTLLGEGAGISPNMPVTASAEVPALNPARSENETVLSGSYWFGKWHVTDPACDAVILDGVTSFRIRFFDMLTEGEIFCAFRNIIHTGPCGNALYVFSSTSENESFDRAVEYDGIRVQNYEDLDYGAEFARINGSRVSFNDVVYDTTGQLFGLTEYSGNYVNAGPDKDSSITLSNSYFGHLHGGIALRITGPEDGRTLSVNVSNTVFADASPKGMPYVYIKGDKSSTLTLKSCAFFDSVKNDGAAVAVCGGAVLKTSGCTYDGFAAESVNLPVPPTEAPDCLEVSEGFYNGETDIHTVIPADKADFTLADALYCGKKAYYGDQHVHTNSGGTSDGKYPIEDWPAAMDEKKLDFAAVVDHRQMRGFFLPAWDEERFIIGTEPGTSFTNPNSCRGGQSSVHYNMLFPHKYGLAMVLANFPEFEFRGDELTGSFKYPKFTKEHFAELVNYVMSIGGIVVHPHPKTMLSSDDPLDYYFGEHTYLETLYSFYSSAASFKNYELWLKLLAMGRHMWTSGGSDTHGNVSNGCVSTFYTKEKSGNAFFNCMKSADYTVGAVGMQMCIDGHPMGSELVWKRGMKLTLRLGDFYAPAFKDNTAYELRVFTDKGLAYSGIWNGRQPQQLSLRVKKRLFYRAEVYDLTHNFRIAIGNPIWLDGKEPESDKPEE